MPLLTESQNHSLQAFFAIHPFFTEHLIRQINRSSRVELQLLIYFLWIKNYIFTCVYIIHGYLPLVDSINTIIAFKIVEFSVFLVNFIYFCRRGSWLILFYGSHLSLARNQKWWSKVVLLHGLIWVIQTQASPHLNR